MSSLLSQSSRRNRHLDPDINDPDNTDMLRRLHYDLCRKYQLHGDKVVNTWCNLTPGQRWEMTKAGAADGVIPENPWDQSLGSMRSLIPEWNLHDISWSPEYFLNILHHRATTTLRQQYLGSSDRDDCVGDHDAVAGIMRTHNLAHAKEFEDCYIIFVDGDKYGRSFKMQEDETEAAKDDLRRALNERLCLPQAVGVLVLMRQLYLMQALNNMMEDVLDARPIGSTCADTGSTSSKDSAIAPARRNKLTKDPREVDEKPTPVAVSLPGVLSAAHDRKAACDEYLSLLRQEPAALAEAVNTAILSRPELVPDDRGRILPNDTRKYITRAALEAVHNAVRAAATWSCICRLLEELSGHHSPNDRARRKVLAQELANLCNAEYTRVQGLLRRCVASIPGYSKWFRRMPSTTPGNAATIVMSKRDVNTAIKGDAQLHHIVRLCMPRTTGPCAASWVQAIDRHQKRFPLERERLEPRVVDALSDVAAIVGFIEALPKIMTMPAPSRKKGLTLINGLEQLEREISVLRTKFDLSKYAVPVEVLKRPDRAETVLKRLDRQIAKHRGNKIGVLYEDLIASWTATFPRVPTQHQVVKNMKAPAPQGDASEDNHNKPAAAPQADATCNGDKPVAALPGDIIDPEAPGLTPPQVFHERFRQLHVRRRKQKEGTRTRTPHPTAYDITFVEKDGSLEDIPEWNRPLYVHYVHRRTAKTFTALFAGSEAGDPIPWLDFRKSMADVGFAVRPQSGSGYAFEPPEEFVLNGAVTFYRPPGKSLIEGHRLVYFRRRLTSKYGWTDDTFQIGSDEDWEEQ
ncbi:hypothetical protein SODALDRAFT_395051 [Sodiomyces alkalinus F11]|uniref:Uncharacterized protein n=1 Tax=Sodiomyces alkalinus (strain CBS 110278 / VKM F-3762 / F11) TaxID=1314773 RepID=A0A3N2PKU8_SODAK|nr:hypothetical protein SODALDRAFT_395051 [Sodiomyces alkalinus F11]ROT35147.1 hypothetical protein SODALDRAFT_395051 [Sodiomyces alkalinus F11]